MRYRNLQLWYLAVDHEGVVYEDMLTRFKFRQQTTRLFQTTTMSMINQVQFDYSVIVEQNFNGKLKMSLEIENIVNVTELLTLKWGRDTCWAMNEFSGCRDNKKITWGTVLVAGALVSQ